MSALSPVLCVPHGGGPLPLLGDESHKPLTSWFAGAAKELPKPKFILTISAHWEVIRAQPCAFYIAQLYIGEL